MEMATVLGNVDTVVTHGLTWAGDVVTFITSNPLVLLFAAIPLVGLGIGLIKRLIG